MTFLLGWIWGFLLSSAVIIVNQNYDAFKGIADAGNEMVAMAVLGFILGSLAILAVMVLSGLLQALTGRKMPHRWATLLGVAFGFACGDLTMTFFPVTL